MLISKEFKKINKYFFNKTKKFYQLLNNQNIFKLKLKKIKF
ncbi:hypothetical protein PSOL_02150 [Candidatus Phytoplasma solani]